MYLGIDVSVNAKLAPRYCGVTILEFTVKLLSSEWFQKPFESHWN